MGLGQIAFRIDDPMEENSDNPDFYWYKHAKLQEFMEILFEERTGLSAEGLHGGQLELTIEDITVLERAVMTNDLPEAGGGMFYGHQSQDERAVTYQEQDLAFCAWARETLSDNAKVVYSCWW